MKKVFLVFCMLLSVGISFANTQRVCGAVPLQVGIFITQYFYPIDIRIIYNIYPVNYNPS